MSSAVVAAAPTKQEREPPPLCLVDQAGYSDKVPWVDTELYAEVLYLVRAFRPTNHRSAVVIAAAAPPPHAAARRRCLARPLALFDSSPAAFAPAARAQAGPRGPANELRRVGALLSALPTTEAEDRALLERARAGDGGTRDWRRELLLRFRVERKRALRARLEQAMRDAGEL